MGNLDTRNRGWEHFISEVQRRKGSVTQKMVGRRHEFVVLGNDGRRTSGRLSTKNSGTWQTSIDYEDANAREDKSRFWVFIDLTTRGPEFYIAPEWEVQRDIARVHVMYLKKHGGTRKVNPKSKHHAIPNKRVQQWRENWSLLGL